MDTKELIEALYRATEEPNKPCNVGLLLLAAEKLEELTELNVCDQCNKEKVNRGILSEYILAQMRRFENDK